MTGRGETELLLCPFCGCDKIEVFFDGVDAVGSLAGHYIHHPVWKTYPDVWGCWQHFGGKFETAEEAAKAWNTRAPASNQARIEELEGALRPFADFADRFGETAREDGWQITNNPSSKGNLTMGDCRNARATLSKGGGSK